MTSSPQEQRLTLQDQLMLLFVHPRTGDIAQPHFRYLLSGAALADLLRQKRLGLEMGKAQVRQTEPLSDRAVDDAFVRFATTSKPRSLAWWARHLYSSQNEPVQVIGERLVERGILTASEHRALWVIRWTTYPVLEPAYGQKLHKQIRAAVMADGETEIKVEPELATLISILHNGRALDRVLNKSEILDREHRIAMIAASDPVGYAVGKAIADALIEEEKDKERAKGGYYGRPVVIVRPPRRHRRPHKPWETTFPGAPDENGVWAVESEDETTFPGDKPDENGVWAEDEAPTPA